jgi:predicted N-acyltransferase
MKGIELIQQERTRQIEQLGWTEDHDQYHTNEELADAAAFYVIPERYGEFSLFWPWDKPHFKSNKSRIRQLTIAGALIAAEIDRLNRETE